MPAISIRPAHAQRFRLHVAVVALACSKSTVAPVPGPRDLNVPRVARLQVSAPCEATPVTLHASASSDADGEIRLYEWDLDNNGTIDTSGAALIEVQHTYAVGSHHVKLVVTDNSGAFNVTASAFTVASTETLPYAWSRSGAMR